MTDLQGLRALLIEPHQGMRASLHNMLSLCGLSKIDDAASASQAIRQLGHTAYELVLCEYELEGGQDGQQLLEDLRHHRLLAPASLFFMVTGEGQYSKVVSVAELQPNDYILKPFAADRILERLARALDKRSALLPVYQLMAQADYRSALAVCAAGAARTPRYAVDFDRLRAELHVLLGAPEQAETIYAALWEARAIPWARLGQARSCYLRGRHAEAQSMLEALVGQQHQFLDAYDWLARVHEAQQRLPQAQQVLSEAIRLSPHVLRRLRKLGEVALAAGDLDTAERALRQVVQKSRHSEFRDPEDNTRLVQVLVQQGDPVAAARVIHELDQTMPGRRNAELCSAIAAAMLHEYTGNAARLAVALDGALAGVQRRAGLSDDLKLELARNCLAHDKLAAGSQLLRSVMGNAGGHAAGAALMQRASAVLERAGQGALATRLAEESRQDVIELVAAGALRARQGDFQGAVTLMLEAVQQLPRNVQVVFNAAVAVLKCLEHQGWDERLGQYALQLIDQVRQLEPGNAKLGALSALHQQILKKYNIRTQRWNEQAKLPAL